MSFGRSPRSREEERGGDRQCGQGPDRASDGCDDDGQHAWQRLQHSVESAANAISFQDLLEESASKEKMYYI